MKNFKRIVFACILALTVLAITACGNKQEVDYSMNDWPLEMAADQYFQSMIAMDDATIDATIKNCEYDQNVPLANGYNSWKSAKAELGGFVEYIDTNVVYDKKGAPTITINAKFENRDCEFVIGLDERMQTITQLTFNPVYSLGEKLEQAGVNLLIGMGTVFAVLIFLAWIISLFKYVHKAEVAMEEKKKAKAAQTAAPSATPAAAPAKAATSVQPVPGMTITPAPADGELTAVIAAAIAAYEEESGCSIEKQPALNNGIVVKSFKRG